MGIDPASLAIGSLVLGGIGTGVSAFGAINQAKASENAEKYNADIASMNQKMSEQSAAYASAAGNAQAEQTALKTRAAVGGIKANQAAANVDINSASALDVRSSAQELGELDALSVRSNAARSAYGYQSQATSYGAQSRLDQYEAENAMPAGAFSAGSTILSGAGDAGLNYSKFLQTQSVN